MENRESEKLSSPYKSSPKKFLDTALGKLISPSENTDTQLVFDLLEAKRRQIKDMQRDLMRPCTSATTAEEFDRQTKSKFYLMPSIRKTPVKSYNQPLFQEAYASIKPRNVKDRSMPEECEVYWYKVSTLGWKPETRQEATLTTIETKLYLIGGVSRSINYDINVSHPFASCWEKLYPGGVEPDPRFGHSALEYKGQIIVFGGGTNFNTVHKLRECLNGIKIFHPSKNLWEYLKTSGTYISTRKYHSATIVGKHLFIYGGLNQKNNLLSDCALLNLEKKTWKSIYIDGPVENAYQTSLSILGTEEKSFVSIYKVPVQTKSVKRPGIYIFGGIGSDKKAHNKMWIVSVGQKPLYWEEVQTEGKGPSPRFLHSMVHVQNYIMIFGGRIDVTQTSTYTCFNDVHMLCLQRLLWVRVKVLGEVPTARSGHCASVLGSGMYIFGGVSNTCYCSSDMYVLETNRQSVFTYLQKDEKKKQFLLDVESYKAKRGKKSKSVMSKSSSKAFSRISITPSKDLFYNQ